MRLELDDAERAFSQRLREWLDGVEVPEGLRDYGSTPASSDVPPGRAWQRMLHEGGWAGLSWPAEHGGAGATVAEQALYAEELARRGLPRQLSFVSMELAGPCVMAFGSPEQQRRHLPPLLRGDETWCQLFSEPGAGSDLAGVRTRATADADGWTVDGQKTWTSGGQYADFGILLARTDPDSARHRGLTCFIVPMGLPGIEIHPIRQMDGESRFNEVFLGDVRLDADAVLGEVGQGWKVALSILGRERRMLGSVAIGLGRMLEELRPLLPDSGATRQRWVELDQRVELLRWTWFRLLSDADPASSASDPRMSILKLVSSKLQQEVPALAADLLGEEFAHGDAGRVWRDRHLTAYAATIAGGTSEIQRSILAERVLGLPK